MKWMLKRVAQYGDRVVDRAIAPKTRWKPGELEARLAPPVARTTTAT